MGHMKTIIKLEDFEQWKKDRQEKILKELYPDKIEVKEENIPPVKINEDHCILGGCGFAWSD